MTTDDAFRAVSDAELTVLKCLWEEGPASPSVLQETLAGRGSDWAYTTVQTLLHRLLGKGYVERRREGATQRYQATRSREELLRLHMDDLAERVCDGEATPLVLSLVEAGRLSRADLRRFRTLIDQAERALGSSGRRKP